MRTTLLVTWVALGAACTPPAPKPCALPPVAKVAPPYPEARRDDVVDLYHGVRVDDPYRWLEAADSPETRAWVESENRITTTYLRGIGVRSAIRDRLEALWDYEKYGVPIARGARLFFTYNPGLLNQSPLYVVDAPGAERRLLLDPNTLSADGTVALSGLAISDDGAHIAYAISRAGSDWQEWKVRDVATATDADDHLLWSKFSGASFTHDGAGFYYSGYDAPKDADAALTEANYDQKLFYHRLGTPQSADVLVYARPDHKEWGFEGEVTSDGRYLVITATRGTETRNGLFVLDLSRPDAKVETLLASFDASYEFVGNDGGRFYLRTDSTAPRGRIVAVDLEHPERAAWREIVPESQETLEQVTYVGGRLIGRYLKDAHAEVKLFSPQGALERVVPLPGLGSVQGLGGRPQDAATYFAYESFVRPPTIYRLDLAEGSVSELFAPRLRFDPNAYETTQAFLTSADGTRLPVFLSHKKGQPKSACTPTYLYGYGGFDISITPWFSPAHLAWMERGGLLAVATLRGGGEYGEAWHQAGMKLEKQNVFDDFAATARWLVGAGYTSRQKLAIGGRSNGGLLVGASITQHPELFGAALAGVGVMDMMRFAKFTIGWAWTSDYGSVEDPDEFRALLAYSPLHNVRTRTHYPPTLLTTADHDDRVVPAHSYKFAAALQRAQAGTAPILIRIETRAGHGAGKPTSKRIDEAADGWAFLLHVMGAD